MIFLHQLPDAKQLFEAVAKEQKITPIIVENDYWLMHCLWGLLGPMVIIADEEGLYLLEFVNRRGLEREVERLRIRKSAAIRAVANANGMNPLGIVVPCHRVINTNGELGSYGGGLARKEWLLKHEQGLIK